MDDGVRPLAGIRVLEMGRLIAAPFCGQILGDLGADVIKVERVGAGDELRGYGPPFLAGDASPGGASSYFLSVNRNKRSIAVDFSRPEGAALIRELAAQSDVFIENFKVGSLKKYGLDEAGIRKVREDIIYLSVSGYGQTGPYVERPATDVVIQGMSGLMSMTGEPGGRPMKVGVSIIDLVTGLYGALAIVSSLYQGAIAGKRGAWTAVSLLDCCMSMMAWPAAWNHLAGGPPLRAGNIAAGNAPSDLFACRDGEVLVQAGKDADFVTLCRILDLEHLPTDPRFASRPLRVQNIDQLKPTLDEAIGRWERDAFNEAMVEAGLISGVVNDVGQALADPQVVASGAQVLAGHPDDPDLTVITAPMRFNGETPPVRRHPPRLGEHTAEVLGEVLRLPRQQLDELAGRGVVSFGRTPQQQGRE